MKYIPLIIKTFIHSNHLQILIKDYKTSKKISLQFFEKKYLDNYKIVGILSCIKYSTVMNYDEIMIIYDEKDIDLCDLEEIAKKYVTKSSFLWIDKRFKI